MTCLLNESRTIRIDAELPDGPKQLRLQPTLWALLNKAKPTDESWATFLIKNTLRWYLIAPSMSLDVEGVHWRSGRIAGHITDKPIGHNGNGRGCDGVERRKSYGQCARCRGN